jgi:hypothetical protein
MPLSIAYGPYALCALAILAYALRRITMRIMFGLIALAYAFCVGRDVSLQHPAMIAVDATLTAISAAGVMLGCYYDRDGYRE